MSEVDREFMAWMAGFWEGEGSLDTGGRISISQKDPTPLKLIHQKFGGRLTQRVRKRGFVPNNPIWEWTVTFRKDTINILEQMIPFLKFRRGDVEKKLEILKEREKRNPGRHLKTFGHLWETFKKEYLAGSSTIEIAKKYGISNASVSRILRKFGVIRSLKDSRALYFLKKGRLPKKDEEIAKDLLKQGKSYRYIARVLGRTHSMIRLHNDRFWHIPVKPYRYTKEEDEVIKRNWEKKLDPVIAKMIGRPTKSVQGRRYRLGLKRDFAKAIAMRNERMGW